MWGSPQDFLSVWRAICPGHVLFVPGQMVEFPPIPIWPLGLARYLSPAGNMPGVGKGPLAGCRVGRRGPWWLRGLSLSSGLRQRDRRIWIPRVWTVAGRLFALLEDIQVSWACLGPDKLVRRRWPSFCGDASQVC